MSRKVRIDVPTACATMSLKLVERFKISPPYCQREVFSSSFRLIAEGVVPTLPLDAGR